MGSKVGVVVRGDSGSVPVVDMWVEFVVGSRLAPRVFLWVSVFPPSKKSQHFQILIRPGRQVFTHESLTREIRRPRPTL